MGSKSRMIGLAVGAMLCIASAGGQTVSTTNDAKVTSTAMHDNWMNSSGAQWVWPESLGDGPNQYVQMVQEFEWPQNPAGTPELTISVDTNYAVWVNGEFVNFGQWSDYPDDKTFDVLDLQKQVRPGRNRLCVLVWYQGQSSSMYLKGAPGAVFAVRAGDHVIAASGRNTRVRRAPDYVSGPMPRVTGQLSFTFEHRHDKADRWLQADYEPDASWVAVAEADMKPLASRPVRPRPVEKLKLGDRLPMRIVSHGAFTRAGTTQHPAAAMQRDSMAWKPAGEVFAQPHGLLPAPAAGALTLKHEAYAGATGPYVVLDTGREEAGLLELEMDAPVGTIVDVGYGEHLEDLRVRTHVGGRNFANRHVCGTGRHVFMHPFLRLAGRYIQLHITPAAGESTQPITIYYAGMRPTDYPVEQIGKFECPNSLHERIWDVSAHTLKLCMHEHYEDCPWREQALYGMDMRNQMLAGYYCFGNYDFARASLYLLGKGLKPDGFLELCAPADIPITIPSFSLAWIMALDDYLLFSGDREFVQSQLPTARVILETCAKESSGSVIRTPTGKRMWNFYEWAPGLDGSDSRGFEVVKAERYEAPLNLFYLLALDAMERISRETWSDGAEYADKSKQLRAEFADVFWDAQERAILTRVGGDSKPHFAELTQALAILADAVPDGELDDLRARLASNKSGLVPCTISHTLYKFEALLTDSERFAPRVFDLIERDWGYMLMQGATSFWETIDGARAFADAGSLCHGWSGIPAWFYGAYLLGVKPTAPGFAKYDVTPVRGVVDQASGRVPTPAGLIELKWKMRDGKILIEHKQTGGN